MRAVLFPGQGSQFVGMGSDFYNKYDEVKKTFDTVKKRTSVGRSHNMNNIAKEYKPGQLVKWIYKYKCMNFNLLHTAPYTGRP